MKEKISTEQLEAMCHGCMWQNENGHCKLINVLPSVQEQKFKANECSESLVIAIDSRMFPLVETSIVAAVRFRMATGIWAMQIKP